MKAIGLTLIFICISSIGIYFYIDKISVLKSIKRTENFLGNLLLCIKNENMTVYEIMEFTKKISDSETQNFLKILKPESLEKMGKIAEECKFSRCKTVTETLNKISSVLGKYSGEEQLKEISFCRENLHLFYEKNEDLIKTKAKLCIYSGFLGGILALILFI